MILFLETVERRLTEHGFICRDDALLLLKLILKLREQRNIADELDTSDSFDAELDELVKKNTFEDDDEVMLMASALDALEDDDGRP